MLELQYDIHVNCKKKYTCNECEGEVNVKGYLTKHQYWKLQYCFKDGNPKIKNHYKVHFLFAICKCLIKTYNQADVLVCVINTKGNSM